MDKRFPTLLDRPGTGSVIGAVFYDVLAFFSLPFLLLLFLQGSFNNGKAVAGVELFYHLVNCIVAVCIFREYLTDTFDDIRDGFKGLMHTASFSAALIFLLALVLYSLFGFSRGNLQLTAYGALPLTEVDLFMLPCDVVATYPILGTLCMVFLAPLAISCLYYGAVFAPICYTRPVLAYIVMAVFLAFPRYCNAATYWDPATEWTLYFTQLPVHLIACRAYQKADSIWAPVLTHMIVNLVSCVLILLTWVLPAL